MMTPHDISALADAVAERITARLAGRQGDESLMDIRGAAELLGCSVPTVERLTRSGDLPSMKVGRLRRYRREDVLARLKQKGGNDE